MMVPRAGIPIPTPTIRNETDMEQPQSTDHQTPPARRPSNPRSSTDPSPSPSLLLQGYFKDKDNLKDWTRPATSASSSHRNRSPYSRSHLRSRSSGAVAGLPIMTRAHSMPSPYTPRPFDTPASGSLSPVPTLSPMRTPARTRSPFRLEEGMSGAGIESIQEDRELDLTPGAQLVQPTAMHAARVPSSGRRRPASPLYGVSPSQQSQQAPTSFPGTSTMDYNPTPSLTAPTSASNSPSLAPQKYNEAYPPLHPLHHHSSTSSMTSLNSSSSLNTNTTLYSHPSTPTSARSRSPSISSLDTIEDEPEMEVLESLKRTPRRMMVGRGGGVRWMVAGRGKWWGLGLRGEEREEAMECLWRGEEGRFGFGDDLGGLIGESGWEVWI